MKKQLKLVKERETKNMVVFREETTAGAPPLIDNLYLPKWAMGTVSELLVTLEFTAGTPTINA